MTNANSWYIRMHLDRLEEELLDNFKPKDEDSKTKKHEIN